MLARAHWPGLWEGVERASIDPLWHRSPLRLPFTWHVVPSPFCHPPPPLLYHPSLVWSHPVLCTALPIGSSGPSQCSGHPRLCSDYILWGSRDSGLLSPSRDPNPLGHYEALSSPSKKWTRPHLRGWTLHWMHTHIFSLDLRDAKVAWLDWYIDLSW